MADQIDIDNLVRELRDAALAMRGLSGTSGTGSSSSKDTNRLIAALARLGDKFDKTSKTYAQREQDLQDFISEVDTATAYIEGLAEATEEQARSAKKMAEEQAKAIERGNMSAKELAAAEAKDRKAKRREQAQNELKAWQAKQAKEVNYAALAARARLDEIAQSKTLQARLESLGDTITDRFGTDAVKTQMAMIQLQGAITKTSASLKEMVGSLASGMGSFVLDLGDGAKSFTQFNGLIDSVTGALGEMAKAIPIAGELISGALKAAAESAKFVLDQLQKTADSFNELGSVGALTAGGLTELKNAQLETGVTLELYTKAIKENSGTLAAFAGTVGSGTQKFTTILKPLTLQGSKTREELSRLGFSLEDITESTGGYLALQTRLGRAQKMRDDQLTQGAAEYAKELDVLSKLTGAQRKDLQAQQEAALSEGRFRAVTDEMSQMGPAGAKAAKTLIDFQTIVKEKMGDTMAQAVRDSSTELTNSAAAIKGFNSTSGELGPIIAQLKSGAIDQDEAYRRLQAALGSNIETQREYAKAMGDEGDVFIPLNEALNGLRGTTINTAKALADQAAQTKPGNDALVDSTVTAQQEMEKAALKVQDFAFNAMPAATRAVGAFTKTLNKFLDEVGSQFGIQRQTPEQAVQESQQIIDQQSDKIAQKEKELARLEALARQTDVYKRDAAGSIAGTKEQYQEKGITGSLFGDLNKLGESTEKAYKDYQRQIRELKEQIKEEKELREEAAEQAEVSAVQKQAEQKRPGGAGAPAKPAAPGAAPTAGRSGMGANDLRNAGLTLKQGDVQAEGSAVNPRLVALAKRIQAEIPGFSYFSGFNDRHHQEKAPSSAHTKGLAADFVLASQPSPEQGQRIVTQLKAMGFNGDVIDEYNNPSSGATAGHIHAAIQAQSGGIFDGPKTGYPATLHGTEAVLPLPEGGRIPLILENFNMQDLVTAVKNVGTAGLGGLPENPAAMSGIGAPIQSFIAPLVTSALTDIENVFSKAGIAPGSAPPAAAAAAPALGAAPEMAASGMAEMMGQLTKLVDLQSRSNKISEKLVRVSTN